MKTLLALTLITAFGFTFNAGAQTNRPAVAPKIEPKRITIQKIERAVPPNFVCESSVGKIMLAGLPAPVYAKQQKADQLEAFIKKESVALKADWKKLKAESAAAPATATSGTPAGNYIRNLNIRQNKLEERDEELADKQKELDGILSDLEAAYSINAVDTGRKYGSYAIWSVVK